MPGQYETERSALPTFYVNAAEVVSGPFDMTLTFGVQALNEPFTGEDEHKGPTEPIARIRMSHAHAKTMLPLLAKVLAEYEQNFGPIPAPGFDELGRSG